MQYILKNTNLSLAAQSTSISAHGLHPEYKEFMLSEKTLPVNSSIPFSGHLNDMEGMVLSFFASFPFSSARNIVELAKEIMCDPKAANKLQVPWPIAPHKMRYGLARSLEKKKNR